MSLARAIETGDVGLLPSRRDEDWRWSDLRGLIRVAPPASPEWVEPLAPGPFSGADAEEILVVNGRGPDLIVVGPGEKRAIALRLIAAPNAGSHLARLAIEVGEGGELTLLESHEGAGQDYLTASDMTIELGAGAQAERIVLAAESESGVAVSIAKVQLAAGSRFEQMVLASGARRERIETVVEHPGAGAFVRLDGVYLLNERRHSDITTVVTHNGVDGITDQLIKGVVQDQARGVFQGRILVAKGADQTDARMGHHALILSDRAEVDAKPELEIWADDVACAHGNTVGALDEDALFYAAQRGIPPDEARALLIQAFVGEAVDRVRHEGAREVARAWVAQRLGASL
jgi:Fe-S cluster assembly protein SufD